MTTAGPCAVPSPARHRRAVIACATVIEEMRPLLPPGMEHHVLDFGLHIRPQELKRHLQQTVDVLAPQADTILLGYGLCSMAVVGLQARDCTPVVPRVDDCIALFLGSGAAYQAQARREPGTCYLTEGWIEAGDHLFAKYDGLVERYGEDKARWLMGRMLKNYTRHVAVRFGLRHEEIPGSDTLIRKMLNGPWDDDLIVAHPVRQSPTLTLWQQNKRQRLWTSSEKRSTARAYA